ncbi:MAG: TauD/TfdA family dioxygenase [Planctomycetaceae bacterium]
MHILESGIDTQRTDDGSTTFPLVLICEPNDATLDMTADWIRLNRRMLYQKSVQHGAILFRGFPLSSDHDFDAFVTAFGLPAFTYENSLSNAVRKNRTPRVFTANEAPSDVTICLHHEMAQTPVYPSRLFFFCEQPAASGGATPLCRSDVLFERIRLELPEFAADCRNKGLRYSHVMPGSNDAASGMGRSWQSTWNASTRSEAEARMSELGYTWAWQDDDCLKVTTPVLPAVKDLDARRTSFFNQLIAAFAGWKDARNDPVKSIRFGDDSPLDRPTIDRVIRMAEEITFDLKWQAGDVALVDNYVTMHGRRSFDGTRSVLASLVGSSSGPGEQLS